MNDFPEPKGVPTWRVACYGLIAAAGVVGIGYWTHDPAMYIVAVFAAVFVGGFGLVLNSAKNSSQIRDESERRRITTNHKSNVLFAFQILATPTAIVGCVSIFDLFVAAPVHETATVIGKYESSTKGGHRYNLQVKDLRVDQEAVPLWFYNECSLNDTVELSLTPIFKEWHQVSSVRLKDIEHQLVAV